MNEQSLKAWSSLLDGQELSSAERKLLEEHLRNHPEDISQLFDDRAVHQMFQLLQELNDPRDRFLEQTIARFEKPDDAAKTTSTTERIEINTRSLGTDQAVTRSVHVPTYKRQSSWAVGILSLATLIVVGLFVIVIKNSSDQNVSREDHSQSQSNAENDNDSNDLEELPEIEMGELVQKAKDGLPRSVDVPVEHVPDRVMEQEKRIDQDSLAEVFVSKDAVFKQPIDSQIDFGTYELLKGQAIFQFDNRLNVVLLGPAEIELLESGGFKPVTGNLIVDAEQVQDELTIEWRDASLQDIKAAQVWIDINENGSNIKLSKGKLALLKDPANSERKVLLDSDGLRQAFVNNTSLQELNPKVLIAHGPNDKYLAQIGVGEEQQEATTPNEFDRLVEERTRQQEPLSVHEQLKAQIFDFNNRLRKMQEQLGGQNQDNGQPPLFPEGFIPGPFGSSRSPIPFSNFREFEKFKRQMKSRLNF